MPVGKLYNLAKMTTATTGTGTITLGSASSGFLTFAQAGVQNGDVVSYVIDDGSNRELGTGTYTSSGTTLTRTVVKSTNSDAAISLSGSATVGITAAKENFHTNPDNVATAGLGYTITGNGSAITTGVAGTGLRVPFNGTITAWSLMADQSGSIVVDIWKDTLANYPPTVADTITASAKPTITSATKNNSSTLTGWTTTITAGDVLYFNVDSCSTIQIATLVLTVTKT